MGFLGNALVQAAVTAVVLGALKRAGIITINPNVIENEQARMAFTSAVDLGVAVAEQGSSLLTLRNGK
jgi:hypothetical protein